MSDNDKSLFSRFSIKNPFARIIYGATPVVIACSLKLTGHFSSPQEQAALISALAASGFLLEPLASVGANVIHEAISEKFFKRFSRKDILENGDLQKAVGDAICATILAIYDEQKSIFKEKQTGFYDNLKGFFQKEFILETGNISLNKEVLKKLSNVPTETWQRLIEKLETDKDKEFYLTIEKIESLYPKNLPDIFAIPAAKFNEVTALNKNTWEKVLRNLCRLQEIETSNDKYPHFTDTITHIAEVLTQNFPELLKHTFVSNISRDGKAYANLQLKIMGEVLFYVRENNQEIKKANAKLEEIEKKITRLCQSLTDGLKVNSDTFNNEFAEIKNLIISNQAIIIEAINNLQTDIIQIKNVLILTVDYSSKTLKQAVLDYLMKIADKATEPNKIYPEEFKTKEKKSIFFNNITQRVQVVKKEQFDIYKAKLDEKARIDGTFREEIDKKVYDQRGFETEMFHRETQKRIEIYEWNDETRKDFKRNVILGDPGLGKSSLLNFEANKIAVEAIEILQNAKVTPEETAKVLRNIKVPINLRIADIASQAAINKELALTIAELASFDEKVNDERKSLELYLKETISKQQNAVLLFDALDEVPEETEKGLKRREIADKISNFAAEYQENSILLTSRKVNYETVNLHNPKRTSLSDDNLEILPFNETQIKNYVAGWFGKESQTTESFLNLLENQSQTAGLSQNPLMLFLMCRVFYEKQREHPIEEAEKHFPNSRCQIYEECLQGLLKDWKDGKSKKTINDEEINDKIAILEETAFHLFCESAEQFTAHSFREKLRVALGIDDKTDRRTKETLIWLEEFKADGLLIETIGGKNPQYRFIHLTFQEYLTASYLAKQPDWKDFILKNTAKDCKTKSFSTPIGNIHSNS